MPCNDGNTFPFPQYLIRLYAIIPSAQTSRAIEPPLTNQRLSFEQGFGVKARPGVSTGIELSAWGRLRSPTLNF
jgi:hypothetical protein